MLRRPILAILVTAFAAVALLGAAEDVSARDVRTFELQPKEFREDRGIFVNWGRDTVLTEHAPDANYKNEQYLNTSASPGKTSEIVLRFPLDQPLNHGNESTLPANVSVDASDSETSATLTLYYRDSMDDADIGRTLDVHRILAGWDEGDLDWDESRDVSSFFSRSPLATSPESSSFQSRSRSWDVSAYMEEVLDPLNPAPFNGFLVRDANPDDDQCGDTAACVQRFYSSNWLENDDENTPRSCSAVSIDQSCLPLLTVTAQMNVPRANNITYEGFEETGGLDVSNPKVFAPEAVLNVSADVWDPAGEIRDVFMDVHHENGTKMFRADLSGNRSRNLTGDRPDLPSSFKTWWNGTHGIEEEGKYVVNLTIRDSDERVLRTGYTNPNLTVDDTDPVVTNASLGPKTLSGGGEIAVNVTAGDAHGIDTAWAVIDHPDLSPVRTDEFRAGAHVEDDGNGSYSGTHTFDFPGEYEVSLLVRDRPGNVAEVDPCEVSDDIECPATVKVLDTQRPSIVESCFLVGGRCVASEQGQETGGNLTFQLRATDNHPTPPEVTLVLEGPDGDTRTCGPGAEASFCDGSRPAPDTWRREVHISETDGWTVGEYRARWIVEDPDGNTRESPSGLPFVLEEAGPPELQDPAPTGWGSASPSLQATVADVNVDPNRIDVAVSVNDEPFESAAISVISGSNEADVAADLGPFVHNDTVCLRLTAVDSFGHELAPEDGSCSWTFTVDDREPRSDLTLEGPSIEGLARQVVPARTAVNVTGEDPDSGVDRVEYRLAPRDGSPGPWAPADGLVNLTDDPTFAGAGPYTVSYRAVDAVGNTGGATSTEVYIDTESPTIEWNRGPSSVEVTVEDPGAGVSGTDLFYRNGSSGFSNLPLELVQNTRDGGVYLAQLPFAPKGTPIQVYFTSDDRLNQTTVLGKPDVSGERPIRWTQPNHHPDVDVFSPSTGATVTGTVDVVWEASDPDGDAYSVDLSARPIVRDEALPVAEVADDPGRARWDTTEVPDGRYELRVTARDGQNLTHGTAIVDVRNTELGLADVSFPASGLDPGESTTVSATIFREVASVEAHVRPLDGPGAATTVDLRDDGRSPDETASDGTHTGTFTAGEEGDYSVDLTITFADGSTEEATGVATFTAESTLAEQLAENRDVVAAAGTLLVVVAVAGVVQLYRYGYI